MADILFIKTERVKDITGVSDNLANKYLKASIMEAQEQGLRLILGDNLTNALKQKIADGTISSTSEAKYRTLLARLEYYLAYRALVEVSARTSYKVGNFGVTKTTDTNAQVATQDEIAKAQTFYESKADSYAVDLQNFLLENRTDYPELTSSHIYKIESNLYSAASCGIFLGGARGRMSYPRKKCRK